METSALRQERRYLKVSAVGNILVGCVGVAVASISSSQAILLDGLFNLTYFATALFTVKVASLVVGGDDERYPFGYSFFEPLVNGIKGTLVFGVSIMALISSVRALLSGGHTIAAGMAISYGVFASTVCWGVALIVRRGVNKTHSPLVSADAKNWFVNAATSSCVLVAFACIFLLRALDLDNLTPYVDPIVVLTVVAISIGVPVRMAWNALMALLNKAPEPKIVEHITQIVDSSLTNLPVKERFIRVIQPGRQRWVQVHAVLPADYEPGRLSALDGIRAQTYQALQKTHVETFVDILFTTDRQWGAPLSDGGFGGQTISTTERCFSKKVKCL